MTCTTCHTPISPGEHYRCHDGYTLCVVCLESQTRELTAEGQECPSQEYNADV